MQRRLAISVVLLGIVFVIPFAHAQQRGKSGEKEKSGEKQGKNEPHNKGVEKPGESKGGTKSPGGEWSEGPGKKTQPNPGRHTEEVEKDSGKQSSQGKGAAAGAAAANRNQPAASGKEGVAAGAAAANRKKPAASGAEGAAAGAAAANRNQPAASGAEGAAVGAAAANRNQPQASGAEGAAAGYAAVRDSFDHPSLYNQQWQGDHPNAWTADNWPAGAAWTATNMAGVAAHCGFPASAVSYGYGNNVINQNGSVIVNGQNVGTSEAFSQQAAELAQIGQNAKPKPSDHWLPLGVFALVRNEDQHAQLTIQLAINKQGILQGNYTDLVSDHTLPIHGSVDKETQRAAWTVGDNKNFFIEAGLSNLTDGDAPALIHKYGRTEQWILVRLPQPKSGE